MWPSHPEKSGRPHALPVSPCSRPSHFQAWSSARAQGPQLVSGGAMLNFRHGWLSSLLSLRGKVAELGPPQRGPGHPRLTPRPKNRACGPGRPAHSQCLGAGEDLACHVLPSIPSGALQTAHVSLDWMEVPSCLGNRLGVGVGVRRGVLGVGAGNTGQRCPERPPTSPSKVPMSVLMI